MISWLSWVCAVFHGTSGGLCKRGNGTDDDHREADSCASRHDSASYIPGTAASIDRYL